MADLIPFPSPKLKQLQALLEGHLYKLTRAVQEAAPEHARAIAFRMELSFAARKGDVEFTLPEAAFFDALVAGIGRDYEDALFEICPDRVEAIITVLARMRRDEEAARALARKQAKKGDRP